MTHDVPDSCLAAIKTIGAFSVRSEKMKPSNVIQCRRCQRYSHTATMCAHAYRCVQCVDTHAPGCCPRTTNKAIPISCCNCKAAGLDFFGHTANDNNNCNFYKLVNDGKANNLAPARATGTRQVAPIARNRPTAKENLIIEAVRANGPTQRNNATTSTAKKHKSKNKPKREVLANSNSNKKVSEKSDVIPSAGGALLELVAALTHVH